MKKNNNKSNTNIKLKILDEAKDIIKVKGWSPKIFKNLRSNDINTNEIKILFPNGYKDLLYLSLDEVNRILDIKIKKTNLINLTLTNRIKKILITRFQILDINKKFYQKTFNHLLLPSNVKVMKKSLYKAIDEMWYMAGDNSTDFNFYTKRLILASIYINALFIFFNSTLDDVELNIDKNLKKLSNIPKLKNKLSVLADGLPYFLKGIFN